MHSGAVAGKGFNVQPNGASALAVEGSNFLPGAKIEFDGEPQLTTFGGPTESTAVVAANRIRSPWIVEIVVRNPDGKKSNAATFTIRRGE